MDELLWLAQMPTGPLTTTAALTYFDDGEFHVRDLGGCGYNGCELFLPRSECRGVVKLAH